MTNDTIQPAGAAAGVPAGRARAPWSSPRVDALPPLVDLTLVTLNLDENNAFGEGIQGGESVFSSPDS